MQKNCKWIVPEWPAPPNIRALTTLRSDGFSAPPFECFNLALHVGDNEKTVQENRRLLTEQAQLPADPFWLQQVHGTNVVEVGGNAPVEADASVAFKPNQVCCVMTADCLPILLCDRLGRNIAAVHAGWRGLAAGVIESTVEKLGVHPKDLLVWLGPAIGPNAFEVGKEVLEAFDTDRSPDTFQSLGKGKWLANLYALAELRLNRIGIAHIFGGDFCTYSESDRFYSYRRSGTTGRMVSLIWMSP